MSRASNSLRSALFAAAVGLTSCATHQHTYNAPDASKLVEAQDRYTKTVDRARSLSKTAHDRTIEARDEAMKVTIIAGTAISNLKTLREQVPAELQKSVDLVMEEVSQLTQTQTGLVDKLNLVSETQDQLEGQFVQAEKDKALVLQEGVEYFSGAKKLADDATRENAFRVKAEKSLSWYRWHWWGSWIALGVGVLLCIALAVLKAMGKLAFI